MSTSDTSLREKALRVGIPDDVMAAAEQAATDYLRADRNYPNLVGPIARAIMGDREAKDRRIEALEAENAELKKQLAAERKPEFFWDYEDPENTYDTPDEAVEYADMGSVVRLSTGKSLPQIWATTRVLTVDERGDWDEHEVAVFDNEADAKRCWPESLEAARAALPGKEGQS